jgi:hypothetical protein
MEELKSQVYSMDLYLTTTDGEDITVAPEDVVDCVPEGYYYAIKLKDGSGLEAFSSDEDTIHWLGEHFFNRS